jgi:hypothetical protein
MSRTPLFFFSLSLSALDPAWVISLAQWGLTLFCLFISTPMAHYAGIFYSEKFRFFQPLAGGVRFCALQAFGWAFYGFSLFFALIWAIEAFWPSSTAFSPLLGGMHGLILRAFLCAAIGQVFVSASVPFFNGAAPQMCAKPQHETTLESTEPEDWMTDCGFVRPRPTRSAARQPTAQADARRVVLADVGEDLETMWSRPRQRRPKASQTIENALVAEEASFNDSIFARRTPRLRPEVAQSTEETLDGNDSIFARRTPRVRPVAAPRTGIAGTPLRHAVNGSMGVPDLHLVSFLVF